MIYDDTASELIITTPTTTTRKYIIPSRTKNKNPEITLPRNLSLKVPETPKDVEHTLFTPDHKSTPLKLTLRTLDWDNFLSKGINLCFIPSVSSFNYAPLSDQWDKLAQVGLKIEVPNPFVRCTRPVYWIATVKAFAGYKAFVEFENLGVHCKYGAWISFFSQIPKPIGYCDKNGILLHPPNAVRTERPMFLKLGRETLMGSRTISENHGESVARLIRKCQKYPLNTILEVMDRDNFYRMRQAIVTGIVGDRIHVTYILEPKPKDPGFWFNVNSEYVHPVGWSQTVGFELYGAGPNTEFVPLPSDYFPKYHPQIVLKEGQMLEARHPSFPQEICAATIEKVYNYGYFLVKFINKQEQSPIKFGFHVTSPYIFPCGWCKEQKISLAPPFGEAPGTFDWKKYLCDKKLIASPLHLIPKRPMHDFWVGHKLEACCCIYPYNLGPATIRKIRDHLLYISFDGNSKNQLSPNAIELWMDAESYDIYPPGYCDLVGHEFQGQVELPIYRDIEERYLDMERLRKPERKKSDHVF